MSEKYFDRVREVLDGLRQSPDYLSGDEIARQDFDYLSVCLNPETPPHQVDFSRLSNSIGYLCPDFGKAIEVETKITALLGERGLLNTGLIETPQEHGLGGTPPHDKDPYIPIGFQGHHAIKPRTISLSEASRARALQVRITARADYFVDPPSNCFVDWVPNVVYVTLEPLDEQGRTVRDPRLIDQNLNVVETRYSDNFPFRRSV